MKKNNKKLKKVGYYIAGSIVLAAGSMAVFPKLLNYMVDNMGDIKLEEHDADDWGPEIIKLDKNEGENGDGQL